MSVEELIDVLGSGKVNEAGLEFLRNNSGLHKKQFYRGIPLHHSLIKIGNVITEYGDVMHWTDSLDMAKWYADVESDNEGCPDMDIVELLQIEDEDIPKEFKPFIMISSELYGFNAFEYLSGHENPFEREREFITTGQNFIIVKISEEDICGKVFYFADVKPI